MSTDYMTFVESQQWMKPSKRSAGKKPEPVNIYSIFILDKHDKLISSISLGELIVSRSLKKLKVLWPKDPVTVFDDDEHHSLAELVSKYNLLAVPVSNKEMKMEGMVVVEDIIDDLLDQQVKQIEQTLNNGLS